MSRKSSSSLSWYSYLQYFGSRRKNKNLGKISIAIGQGKLLREKMYRRTDEETMYCSITKISIQSVIGITNNFEALCTSLLRHYPWYTRRIWIEPQSAVTGMSVVNTHRMKWTFLVVIRISADVHPGGCSWEFLLGVCRPDPFSGQKRSFQFDTVFQTWPLKSIPVFRPGL